MYMFFDQFSMVEYRRCARLPTKSSTAPACRSVSYTHLDTPAVPLEDLGNAGDVLGTSGGGKTTFIKLINRLHDPDTGTVLVNGQDVSQVDPVELRRGIGLSLIHI